MKANNITGDYAKLEEIYVQNILEISEKIGFSYIVWQEVFDNGVKVGVKGYLLVNAKLSSL